MSSSSDLQIDLLNAELAEGITEETFKLHPKVQSECLYADDYLKNIPRQQIIDTYLEVKSVPKLVSKLMLYYAVKDNSVNDTAHERESKCCYREYKGWRRMRRDAIEYSWDINFQKERKSSSNKLTNDKV